MHRQGYVASAVGAVLGGAGLLELGRYLGEWYADRYMPNAELEVLLPIIIGSLGGYWIGVIAGTWVALRLRSYTTRLGTAALVGLLAPLPFVAMGAVDSVIDGYSRMAPSIAGLIVLAGIAIAARSMALHLTRRRGARSGRRLPTEQTS